MPAMSDTQASLTNTSQGIDARQPLFIRTLTPFGVCQVHTRSQQHERIMQRALAGVLP